MWEDNLHCNKCPRLSMDIYSPWTIQPSFLIYLSKYFFLLIVGITTGLWINLNSKTLLTWRKFFCCQTDYLNEQQQQQQNSRQHHRYVRDPSGINYSYKHTKISGSKYSLPSSKQVPLAHV